MAEALYTRDILRLATAIPHLGHLPAPDAAAACKSPVCGSRVSVEICLNDKGQVTDFAQDVHACALGQAAAAVVGQHVVGRTLDEVEAGLAALNTVLAGHIAPDAEWPGLDVFSAASAHPARHASIRLAFQAVQAAIKSAH